METAADRLEEPRGPIETASVASAGFAARSSWFLVGRAAAMKSGPGFPVGFFQAEAPRYAAHVFERRGSIVAPSPKGEQMMTETSLITLCGEALPCAHCGQVVPVPDRSTVESHERVRRGRVTHVLMTQCQHCVERDREAADLARLHLRFGVTVGDRLYSVQHAVRFLVDARAAFDAAGMQPRPVGANEKPVGVLTAEVAHLRSAVAGLRWRDRLNPPESLVAEPGPLVEPGTANRRPWAHLEEGEHTRLREGVGRVLNERVALLSPPAPLPPPKIPQDEVGQHQVPVASGCLYCGIGSITLSALGIARHGGAESAARSVWTLRRVDPVSIGARKATPVRLLGWLCPPCEDAAAAFGSASSATALEEALSGFLGISRRTLAGDELWVSGLKSWGALVADALHTGREVPTPNPEPWGHLPKAARNDLVLEWQRGGP